MRKKKSSPLLLYSSAPPGSHPRLVDDPGHGTNCGGNDRRHMIQHIVSLFIKPAPCSQTYNIPVYNNMITASLLDVTLGHTTDYSMWSHRDTP